MQWRNLAMVGSMMAVAINGATADHSTTTVSVSATDANASSEPSSSASETSSAAKATHTIQVGAPVGQHAFKPETTEANAGDLIVFQMLPANHSVVWMDKDSPCIPWNLSNPGDPYMKPQWSGFYPLPDDYSNIPMSERTFNITIPDKNPIWFYCSAPGSCIDFRMVGAINPNSTEDLAAVKQAAANANFYLSPGGTIPAESSATATSSSNNNNDDGGNSLSAGAIAGIVIGAVAAFALVGLLFFLVGRKKKATAASSAAAAAAAAPPAPLDAEHAAAPPMYQSDPRYSQVPGSPQMWGGGEAGTVKTGHGSMMSDVPTMQEERHPHRLSELASQNYDPVEIYTPGLPEHHEIPSPTGEVPTRPMTAEEASAMRDTRRDTVG